MGNKEYYAHTDPDNPGNLPEEGGHWQLLKDHLEGTAKIACEFASVFESKDWGYIAGLLHDTGKYSQQFQDRLRATVNAHIEQNSRIDHSTYGARVINQKWPKGEGKVLSYCIAGHHAGLPDGKSNDASCLYKRVEKPLPYDFNCPETIFDQKKPELPFIPNHDKMRFCFETSFFTRMIYSCLVDADFLDTEKHMAPEKAKHRPVSISLSELHQKLKGHLTALENRADKTEINTIRGGILKDCLKAAKQNAGLFSLTVPTGGGKTLSSMAFGLDHAIRWGHRRIIYVIPYTSIIEQNADVFRKIFGDDIILEHHSNYEPKKEDYRSRLASENWDAPIVVTTNVQFFESLFAYRSSRSRKLHNIAGSVIVLDEVQSLPSELLLPCLEAIRELASHYNCSIVLCSATQPAIGFREDFTKGLENVREIVCEPDILHTQMKRVKVENLKKQSNEQIIQRIVSCEQVLCIVNTKKQARKLFDGVRTEENAFHLSTLMTPIHRSGKFQMIRRFLDENKPCKIISTQLIEAGVDIDFPVVLRAVTGIDSIAQAAGRCNREGRLECGKVFIFEPEDGLPPGYFRHTAQTAEGIMRRFPNDILSLEAIEEYFREYYWFKGEKQLDEKGILDMLQAGIVECDFPFRQIADSFRLIEQATKPVVVPFSVSEDEEKVVKCLLEKIEYADNLRGYSRRLQKYTVQVHHYYWNKLMENGCLEIVRDMFPVLINSKRYDEDTGLNIYDFEGRDPVELIF